MVPTVLNSIKKIIGIESSGIFDLEENKVGAVEGEDAPEGAESQ